MNTCEGVTAVIYGQSPVYKTDGLDSIKNIINPFTNFVFKKNHAQLNHDIIKYTCQFNFHQCYLKE